MILSDRKAGRKLPPHWVRQPSDRLTTRGSPRTLRAEGRKATVLGVNFELGGQYVIGVDTPVVEQRGYAWPRKGGGCCKQDVLTAVGKAAASLTEQTW